MANSPTDPPELPEAPNRPHRPINLVAGTIGHFVEWYDWYIYGLLAAVFARQIFPSHSPFASLIAALLTYAIGFVVRPFSGIIISPLADRYGRRVVLALTISGMALGSLIIALTPGLPRSATRHRSCSCSPASCRASRPAANSKAPSPSWSNTPPRTGEACSAPSPTWPAASRPSPRPVPRRSSPHLRPGQPSPTWGWRIPFLIGGILGLVGLLLRASADETPEFEASSVWTTSPRQHDCWHCCANTPRLCCRPRRCPPRPSPTTPGPPSCPPTPA